MLDSADKLLADLDAMLRETGVAGIEETIQANMIARVDEVIVRLTAARDEAEASGDANTAQQLQAVIDGLVDLKEAIGTVSTGGARWSRCWIRWRRCGSSCALRLSTPTSR